MAEEKEEQQEEQEKKKEKGKLGLPAIIGLVVGVLLVQAGIVFAVVKFFLAPPHPAEQEAEQKKEKSAKVKVVEEEEEPEEEDEVIVRKVGKLIPVGEEDIIVNARSRSPEPRYVVLRVVLEIDDEAELDEKQLEEILIPVKDEIIDVVSSHWIEEFLQPGFKQELRKEIKKRIQPYFGEVRVRKVRFTKYLVQ